MGMRQMGWRETYEGAEGGDDALSCKFHIGLLVGRVAGDGLRVVL